jgi:AraC family transcriptional regulator, transcriptional activator FtrA
MSRVVGIVAYDRLCTFEFGCAVEFFALDRPELNVAWYRSAVCAIEDGPLRAAGGIRVKASHGLAWLRRSDIIVVPGWRDSFERPPEPLLKVIRSGVARGAQVLSICSGVFVLAHAGVLDGKRATTHWRYAQQLANEFPEINVDASSLYIDEGQVITSAGSAAGLDMLLHLARNHYGPTVANMVAQRLVMAPHREGNQAQFVPRPVQTQSESPISALLDHVRANPQHDHSVESMAAFVCMSRRTFQRRFTEVTGHTPQEGLTRERIAAAKELLETQPKLGIEFVAEAAGFGSAESMRRHFKLHNLTAPSRYREQFTLSS